MGGILAPSPASNPAYTLFGKLGSSCTAVHAGAAALDAGKKCNVEPRRALATPEVGIVVRVEVLVTTMPEDSHQATRDESVAESMADGPEKVDDRYEICPSSDHGGLEPIRTRVGVSTTLKLPDNFAFEYARRGYVVRPDPGVTEIE
jgi:hypothetical protein